MKRRQTSVRCGVLGVLVLSAAVAAASEVERDWRGRETAGPTTMMAAAGTVATPKLSSTPPWFTSSISVSISCATPGVTIRYTTDGSTPILGSPVYRLPFTLSKTTTVKARAYKAGWTTSAVATKTFVKGSTPPPAGPVEKPTFSPAAGTYTYMVYVSISCSTPGATIRYTTNGSDPTSSSPVYSSSLRLYSTTTVRARAFKTGMTSSDVASAKYTITPIEFNTPKYVTFTRARHPSFLSAPSAQTLFDNGAALLRTDDDGYAGGGANDDVSLDVRFTIKDAGTFPDWSWNFSVSSGQRYNYRDPKYNNITNETVLRQLLAATFASVKQVSYCYAGTGCTVGGNRNSMVLTGSANAQTAVHEWGHLCGLLDVYDSTNSKRIMYGYRSSTKNEINATERTAMRNY